jgi:hypothetical protein
MWRDDERETEELQPHAASVEAIGTCCRSVAVHPDHPPYERTVFLQTDTCIRWRCTVTLIASAVTISAEHHHCGP